MPLFSSQTSGLDALIRRPPDSLWQRLCDQPYVTIGELLRQRLLTPMPPQPLRDPVDVVCVSDTHGREFSLPRGDILVHAGDLTQSGSCSELQAALDWLQAQPHAVKVVVAGNHDVFLDSQKDSKDSEEQNEMERTALFADRPGLIYLHDSSVTVKSPNGRRLLIHGSPHTPQQGNWGFQYPRAKNVWGNNRIPDNVDILVTHGPPRAHLDLGFGCEHLLQELWRARPRLHVCGHIHAAAGTEFLNFDDIQKSYERLLVEKSLWRLCLFLWCCAVDMLRGRRAVEAKTVIVNAAMIGGIRDELRREAVVITI